MPINTSGFHQIKTTSIGGGDYSSTLKQAKKISKKNIVGRVTDIVLDENHPRFNEVGQWSGIGSIFFEGVETLKGSSENNPIAKPLFPQFKNYPLVNEIVLLFALPNNALGSSSTVINIYYLNPINLWNSPHHNGYTIQTTLPNITPSYLQVENGIINNPTAQDQTVINLNSSENPSQGFFPEKDNIYSLMAYNGDNIFEGRNSNSIRLGSTIKSNSKYKNIWSEGTSKNGDPIVIIRNGQPSKVNQKSWEPIVEDLNKDMSSLWMTSTQKLPINNNWENKFKVFTPLSRPISLSTYSSPQAILTSDRIILNAKTDSILISGEQHFNVAVGKYVNIDSENLYIDAEITKLGSKSATEPVLKGDTTVKLLKQLTKAVQDLAKILEVEKKWPGGILKTEYNTIAGNVLTVLEDITNQLNNDSLKSQTTQVK